MVVQFEEFLPTSLIGFFYNLRKALSHSDRIHNIDTRLICLLVISFK